MDGEITIKILGVLTLLYFLGLRYLEIQPLRINAECSKVMAGVRWPVTHSKPLVTGSLKVLGFPVCHEAPY